MSTKLELRAWKQACLVSIYLERFGWLTMASMLGLARSRSGVKGLIHSAVARETSVPSALGLDIFSSYFPLGLY